MDIQVTPRAEELFKGLNMEAYRAAYGKGMSLSAYLEAQDPSSEYKDGLDAFGRLMKAAGIRTNDVPEYGVWADDFGAFDKSDNARALAPEWIARQWRRASFGKPDARSLYTSYDNVLNSWANQYADAPAARSETQITPAIPLASLVAITTPISTDAYRAAYLTIDATQLHMARVAEGAEVPKAKMVSGEHTIRLAKYGRALEASYEALRRQRLPRLAMHIQLLAAQNEVDKVTVALDTLINGDGNNNAATSYNLTTLDSGTTASNPTVKAWLAFKMKFANPYAIQVALTQEAIALQLMLLNMGSANVPLVNVQGVSGFGSFRHINTGLADSVGLGWSSSFPANTIVGIDTRMALERVTEIGSNIQEVERYVTRQTQSLVMTEVEGFAVIDKNATKLIATNA